MSQVTPCVLLRVLYDYVPGHAMYTITSLMYLCLRLRTITTSMNELTASMNHCKQLFGKGNGQVSDLLHFMLTYIRFVIRYII